MPHAVLLGDSVFDNAAYVPGELPVIELLKRRLPAGWQATCLAIDGNVTADVAGQMRRLPTDATHIIVSVGKPTIACTIYDAIPGLELSALAALSLFNDVIVHEAARARVPVIDLRLVCTEPQDFSAISPIEPSFAGGEKIASAIVAALTGHDLAAKQTAD